MSDSTNTFSAYLGPDFQQSLMWQLLVEPEFAEKTIPNLEVEYFDDPYLKRLFLIILEYYKEYEKVPNLQNKSIHLAINSYKTPNNIIEEESLFAVIKRVELWNERVLNKEMLYDGIVVQKATNNFIKQQEYRKIGEYILAKTKSGEIKHKHTLGYIEEKFLKISHIGEEEDYGTEVTDNIEKALRKEFRETIPTGVEVIDVLTGGGLGKGEIGVILTPSGVGKTTLLTKIANTGLEVGKNVLQIVFEDTVEQIQRKHFTIWTKSKLSQLNEDDENERVTKLSHEKADELRKRGRGKLMIKKFSQENTTMMDIRNWITRHQKKYGYVFDEIVLDYLDCLESHKKTADRNEAELVIVKSFEALAGDLNIPAWTAIQSNRSGFDSEFVEVHQTGGNIKRVQKAHFFMSVAKTPEQKEAHLANIRIIKARFAQDGQTFTNCIFNNDTMEIKIEDDRYKYSKMSKNIKHHDTPDIDKLEDKTNKTGTAIHIPVSEYYGNIIEGKLKDDAVNDTPNDAVKPGKIQSYKDSLEDLMSGKTGNNVPETVEDIVVPSTGSILEIDEEATDEPDGVSDGVNEGVSEGVNEGINTTDTDFIMDSWTGETFYTNVIEKEVELKDVPNIVQESVETLPEIQERKEILPPVQKNINTEIDVNDRLIDPDAPQDNEKFIKEKLAQLRKRQNVIKKE
jgi:replicative DNA helicase